MTREELIKAISEYNIQVSTLLNLYYKDIDVPLGFYDCKCDCDNIPHYYIVVQSDLRHINFYDDLCKFFRKKQIEYKQNFIKNKFKEISVDFE